MPPVLKGFNSQKSSTLKNVGKTKKIKNKPKVKK